MLSLQQPHIDRRLKEGETIHVGGIRKGTAAEPTVVEQAVHCEHPSSTHPRPLCASAWPQRSGHSQQRGSRAETYPAPRLAAAAAAASPDTTGLRGLGHVLMLSGGSAAPAGP
eukprot:scaffold1594_cov401-Prasinococcus_capsulatus_cf.AAC.25